MKDTYLTLCIGRDVITIASAGRRMAAEGRGTIYRALLSPSTDAMSSHPYLEFTMRRTGLPDFAQELSGSSDR